MNVALLIAAATLFFIGAMHTILAEWQGKRRLVRRIVESDLFDPADPRDILAKRIVRLAWHLTSVTWCGVAATLAYLSLAETPWPVVVAIRMLALTFLCCALLSLAIARGRHASWLLFLTASVLAFLGTVSAG